MPIILLTYYVKDLEPLRIFRTFENRSTWSCGRSTRMKGFVSISSSMVEGTVACPACRWPWAHNNLAFIFSLSGSTVRANCKFFTVYCIKRELLVYARTRTNNKAFGYSNHFTRKGQRDFNWKKKRTIKGAWMIYFWRKKSILPQYLTSYINFYIKLSISLNCSLHLKMCLQFWSSNKFSLKNC